MVTQKGDGTVMQKLCKCDYSRSRRPYWSAAETLWRS